MKLRNGGALKFFFIASCELLPLIYLIYSKKINYFYLSIIILFSGILIFSLGARSLIFSMFLSVIIYFITLSKLKKSSLLILFSILSFFFLLTSINRSNDDGNIGKYLVRNLDQLVSTSLVIDKINKNQIDYQYGSTIVDAFYFFLPSSLFPSKPKSYAPSRVVYPEMISRGIEENTRHTMNFGLIGRGFLEFGLIGVFFFTLVYLKLFNSFYFKIINNDFNNKINKFYVLMAYSHIHQFIILGATSHIYSIILLNLLIFMIIDFSIRFFYQFRNYE